MVASAAYVYVLAPNHGNHGNQRNPNIGGPTESPVKKMPPKKKKSFIGTPDLVPWLPPGKTKEETFNSFAHKKNSGVYDLSASAQANDKIWSTSNSKKFSTESSPWSIRWNKE